MKKLLTIEEILYPMRTVFAKVDEEMLRSVIIQSIWKRFPVGNEFEYQLLNWKYKLESREESPICLADRETMIRNAERKVRKEIAAWLLLREKPTAIDLLRECLLRANYASMQKNIQSLLDDDQVQSPRVVARAKKFVERVTGRSMDFIKSISEEDARALFEEHRKKDTPIGQVLAKRADIIRFLGILLQKRAEEELMEKLNMPLACFGSDGAILVKTEYKDMRIDTIITTGKHALARAGIVYLKNLQNRSREDLLGIKGYYKRSYSVLRDALGLID